MLKNKPLHIWINPAALVFLINIQVMISIYPFCPWKGSVSIPINSCGYPWQHTWINSAREVSSADSESPWNISARWDCIISALFHFIVESLIFWYPRGCHHSCCLELEEKICSCYTHNPDAFFRKVIHKWLYPSLHILWAKLAFCLDKELSLRQYEFQTLGGPCYPHIH